LVVGLERQTRRQVCPTPVLGLTILLTLSPTPMRDRVSDAMAAIGPKRTFGDVSNKKENPGEFCRGSWSHMC